MIYDCNFLLLHNVLRTAVSKPDLIFYARNSGALERSVIGIAVGANELEPLLDNHNAESIY